ncbi:MAG TPA: glycine cleavage system aminomethyltransferase GcvT [Pirellulales bacterium]|nr:glycine cleavage system aminomethyltransferase GcvT [Pirellulales bacterium]
MTVTLLTTPLHDWHAAHGGRMVDFAGWSMPVQYTSIVAEHTATRTAAGLFDVSHMGRLRFFGSHAADFLDSVVTRRVSDMRAGQVRYSLVTNEDGGILDDVLIYRGYDGGENFGMVVNASNREKIVQWLGNQQTIWQSELGHSNTLTVSDDTLQSAMIAVQGPKAVELLEPVVETAIKPAPVQDFKSMGYYTCWMGLFDGDGVMFSRTGYTGEDGFEIICDEEIAPQIWEVLTTRASKLGGMAAGLGARDTLRLEAAMPLYGHELNEQTNPLEAGLGFAVNLEGRKFPGCEVLAAVKREGPKRVRVGLELAGKRAAREHYAIFGKSDSGQPIGEISSGTFSPTLQKPIAMGYVPPQFAQPGTELFVDIRGSREPARVVKLPFYKRR